MENKGENTPDERLFLFSSIITPSKGRKRHRGQISKKTNKGLSPPAADTTQFFFLLLFFDGWNIPTVFFMSDLEKKQTTNTGENLLENHFCFWMIFI